MPFLEINFNFFYFKNSLLILKDKSKNSKHKWRLMSRAKKQANT